jgi:hypothetical protein
MKPVSALLQLRKTRDGRQRPAAERHIDAAHADIHPGTDIS